MSKYKTNSDNIKCKCLIDGFEWETSPYTLLRGHGCPKCSHRKQNWYNSDRFYNIMQIKYPTISVLNKFTKTSGVIKLRCNVCGYDWQTVANVLLNKDNYCGCPKCSGFAPVSEQEMIARLQDKNKRVEYICGYTKMLSHATFKCVKCGNEWETTPCSVLSGRGCPKCNMSVGALKVEEILKNIGLDYKKEYRFKDCRDIRPLPFDFYITSKNVAIEYDGEQHFIPIRFDKHSRKGSPEQRFEQLQKRDKIKTNYCKNNNITLIRIPYTEFDNIEKILNKYLA